MMRQINTLLLEIKIIKTRRNRKVKKKEKKKKEGEGSKQYLSKMRRQVKKTEFSISKTMQI